MTTATLISILVSLFVLEVLLSVDNALVNATIAENLPAKQRVRAIRIGILLGAVFRIVALFAAAIIIQNEWIKVVGGFYLVYLFVSHLGKEIDEEGHVVKQAASYKRAIFEIALADIVFSLDNVISAVSFSDNIYVVMLGVGIGVVSMLFITPILSKMIHKYKSLASTAYFIVGFIGVALILETLTHIHITELFKFFVILSAVIFTIFYDTNQNFNKTTKPILKKAALIVGIPLDILRLLKRVFKKVI